MPVDPTPVALNHLHLTAEDPDAVIRFYSELLGFRRDPSLPGFMWLGSMQMAVTKGEPIRNPRFHIGFRMDSNGHVDALRAKLIEHGVEVSEPFASGSSYSCGFTDPAGYRVEVYSDAGISALGTLA